MTSNINTIDYYWNKFPTLEINNIEFNSDKDLLIFSTNSGYRIYDSKTFTLLSNLNDKQLNLGSLKKASVFYSSYIICFLASDNNDIYQTNQIFFYNDYKNKIMSIINFQERVFIYFLTKYLLFICLWKKILIFELTSLKCIYQIFDVDVHEDIIAVNEDYNDEKNLNIIHIGFISTFYEKENVVSVYSFIIKNNTITHLKQNGIITIFKNITKIYFNNYNKLIVVSELGNKIHIYQTDNNQLLYCIYMGNHILNISNLSFNSNEKFLLCICDLDEINIYKLKNINNKYKCNCYSHPDKEIKKRRKSSNNSFLGGYFTRMFNDSTEPFLYNSINECGGFYKCYFDYKRKDEITLINNFGSIIKYKFNRKKEKEKLKVVKTIQVIEEDLDDEFI